MTVTVLACCCAVLAVTSAAGLWMARSLRKPAAWLDRAVRRRLVVHTTADKSFDGLLVTAGADGVLLADCRLLASPKPVALAGEVWIPRAQVLFVQTSKG